MRMPCPTILIRLRHARTRVLLTPGPIGAILANDRYWPDVCKDGRDI